MTKEEMFDCRAPEAGEFCGACVTCLNRKLDVAEAERDVLKAQLATAQARLSHCDNHREALVATLAEVQAQAAEMRAWIAARAHNDAEAQALLTQNLLGKGWHSSEGWKRRGDVLRDLMDGAFGAVAAAEEELKL